MNYLNSDDKLKNDNILENDSNSYFKVEKMEIENKIKNSYFINIHHFLKKREESKWNKIKNVISNFTEIFIIMIIILYSFTNAYLVLIKRINLLEENVDYNIKNNIWTITSDSFLLNLIFFDDYIIYFLYVFHCTYSMMFIEIL